MTALLLSTVLCWPILHLCNFMSSYLFGGVCNKWYRSVIKSVDHYNNDDDGVAVVAIIVEAANLASCNSARRQTAVVTGQSGYLSGVWAAETGCGTVDAPWQVRVQSGQRINVTMFDFTVPATTSNHTSSLVDHANTAFNVAAGSLIR